MFEITDADWRKLTLPGALPEAFRQSLVELGRNHHRFRDLRSDQSLPSEVRKDLSKLADLTADLALLARKLDLQGRMALVDVAEVDETRPWRRDAFDLFNEHVQRFTNFENWCRRAADQIPEALLGRAAHADDIKWLVEQFAYTYTEATGQPFTMEGRSRRLLGDFVEMVDPTVSERQLSAAILSTGLFLQD